MSPTVAGCLTLEAFQHLVNRSADPDNVRRWASHLAGCPACLATTRSLQAEVLVIQAITDRLGPWEPLLAAVRAGFGMVRDTPSSVNLPPTSPPYPTDTFVTIDRVIAATPPFAAV